MAKDCNHVENNTMTLKECFAPNPLSALYYLTSMQLTLNSNQLFSSCFILSMVRKMRIRTLMLMSF